MEVLSQDEIDQLLTAIDAGDGVGNKFNSIEVFENYLTNREFSPEEPYGIFDKDISICRYFGPGGNENLLEDIKKKNEEQGYGNVTIPNTNIMLINYSFCPKCKAIFGFKEIVDYYKNPKPDPLFKNRGYQYRNYTRVFCNNCSSYFLPSLIISDGTPKNEVQFLCRSQTIEAVEKYFFSKKIKVLTTNRRNIVQKGNLKAIKNDVYIKDLDKKPTLITNIVQYTPLNLIMNLIDGSNVAKGDLLFDEWK